MLLHEFLKQQGADEKLIKLFAECITAVSVRIRQAIERGDTHKVGSENASGEQQIALDVRRELVLTRYPYSIYYRVTGKRAYVRRVVHQRRLFP